MEWEIGKFPRKTIIEIFLNIYWMLGEDFCYNADFYYYFYFKTEILLIFLIFGIFFLGKGAFELLSVFLEILKRFIDQKAYQKSKEKQLLSMTKKMKLFQ